MSSPVPRRTPVFDASDVFVEALTGRRRRAAAVSVAVLATATGLGQLVWFSPLWWLLALTLTGLLARAAQLFNDPLAQFRVTDQLLALGDRRLWRGQVRSLSVSTRPSWSGPVVTRLVADTDDGPVTFPLSSLGLTPAPVLSVLAEAGWPLQGRRLPTAAPEVVQVPTGAALSRRTAFDMGLVTLVPAALIALLPSDDAVALPVAVLVTAWLASWGLVTVVAVARLGWCVRFTMVEGSLVVEDADGVAVIDADSLAVLGTRGGALYLRTSAGTPIRLLAALTEAQRDRLAAAATAAGIAWEDRFALTAEPAR